MSDLQTELNLGFQSKFQTRLEHPVSPEGCLRSQTAVAPGPGPPLRLQNGSADILRITSGLAEDGSPLEQESNLRAMSRILPRHARRPGSKSRSQCAAGAG